MEGLCRIPKVTWMWSPANIPSLSLHTNSTKSPWEKLLSHLLTAESLYYTFTSLP